MSEYRLVTTQAAADIACYQTMIGFWLQAMKVPKRAITVLNQLGVSVSYDSIRIAVRAVSHAALKRMRNVVKSGKFFGICWDNLALPNNKKETTEMNRGSLDHCTTSYMYEMVVPPPLDAACPADVQAYDDIIAALEENARRKRVGIPRELVSKVNPDYDSLQRVDFLFGKNIEDYWPDVVTVHLSDFCHDFFGPAAMAAYTVDGQRLERPSMPEELYRIPRQKSRIHPLKVLDIDESSIDGNAQVIEAIASELDIDLALLNSSSIMITGDQMTTARVRSLKDLRVRDMLERRLGFADTISGWLHTEMAVANGIQRCHSGRRDGLDPGSLNRFITVLGRTGISENVTDHDALHRLIIHVFKGHLLAAFLHVANEIERTKANGGQTMSSIKQLKSWIRVNDWRKLLDRTVDTYFAPAKPGWLRQSAEAAAAEEYDKMRSEIMAKPKKDRSADESAFVKKDTQPKWIRDRSMRDRDLVYENFILYLRDAMMYWDLVQAIGEGGSGRLLRISEMLTPWFHGNGKFKYAQELLEFQITRMAEWTPAAEYLYKNNCLLSIHGHRFAPVDQIDEGFNNDIKVAYNPRGNMQSKEYQKTHLARCLMTFRGIRQAVQRSSEAQSYGHSHSQVDASGDISRVADLLVKDNAMLMLRGRSQSGPPGGKVEVSMAVDSFHKGCQVIMRGPNVSDAIQKRQKPAVPDVALAAYADLDAFMEGYNGQWFDQEEELDKRMGRLDIEPEAGEREQSPDPDGLRDRDWRIQW
jgi:hypothetical protein